MRRLQASARPRDPQRVLESASGWPSSKTCGGSGWEKEEGVRGLGHPSDSPFPFYMKQRQPVAVRSERTVQINLGLGFSQVGLLWTAGATGLRIWAVCSLRVYGPISFLSYFMSLLAPFKF